MGVEAYRKALKAELADSYGAMASIVEECAARVRALEAELADAHAALRKGQVMGEGVLWRVGRSVPKNVYRGDEIAGQFQREEWAHQAVEALNRLETQMAVQEAEHQERVVERHGKVK